MDFHQKKIRFRKPKFDEASFDLKNHLTIDITLQ